jgi:hypothetical protein
MIKTKNFNPVDDVKLICTCEHDECDKRSVSMKHLRKIQLVRDIVKHPMAVTSGGRCPNHPDEIGRSTPADHQKGFGIDIAANGQTRGNIVQAAIFAGCNAIGVGETFVHLGFREKLPYGHITMWSYQ